MTNAISKRERKILRLTVATIKDILQFKVAHDIQKLIIERLERNYNQFEEELHNDYEIKGAGVLATIQNIRIDLSNGDDGILRKDEPLAPEDITSYINSFPLAKASASYIFTIVEVYGNSVADIVNPGSIPRNKAWHEDVRGSADLRDKVQLAKACEAFGKHFSVPKNQVLDLAARRMVRLKNIRNAFAHEESSDVDFLSYMEDAVAVICHIAFMMTGEERISIYPWEDHHKVFDPQSTY